jgi:hypothetical protein
MACRVFDFPDPEAFSSSNSTREQNVQTARFR